MIRAALLAGWLLLGGVPLAWWLADRRRVDVWRALPVPAALLDRTGEVREVTGPAAQVPFGEVAAALGELPAAGRVVRARAPDGVPVAVTGLPGGALAVALAADPVGQRRDRLLADLGARLAHDINTPLAALVGHLDLIAHEPIGAPALASVRTCQRELLRLQTTAADLLTFTRLRAGGAARSRQLAGALVEEAAGAFWEQADGLGVQLRVEVPPDRVVVQVAEADLVRALRNLIGNALRHGGGGDVLVSAGTDPGDPGLVLFAVADRGPGMSPQELAELSQPLARGRAAPDPDGPPPGSGLGLAIVTEVLAGHGSTLQVAPRPGGGAVLSFALPRAR